VNAGAPAPPDLQQLREEIEHLDRDLLTLLKRRMAIVEGVAGAKLQNAAPFRDPQREEQVLRRVRHLGVELGLDAHRVESLYRAIMEMSIAHQQAYVHGLDTAPLRVAYQGIEGSNSHLAAQRRYASRAGGALLTGFDDFRHAVEAVRDGESDLALLPIENSTAGSINETYDLLAEGGVVIIGELVSAIEHCLVGFAGTPLGALRLVISHPQALRQCERFLRTLPSAVTRSEFDTAGAARKVRESGDPTQAAVASADAAARHGLAVLAREIKDERHNFTRFVELAREASPCPPDSPCKTSLLVDVAHRPSALGDVLGELGRRDVNLCKLESRPIPSRPWQYRFYLDLEGHAASATVAGALEAVRPLCAELRVLGTYPRAEAV
jgi:chorismate mutase/prephenate dehydratase